MAPFSGRFGLVSGLGLTLAFSTSLGFSALAFGLRVPSAFPDSGLWVSRERKKISTRIPKVRGKKKYEKKQQTHHNIASALPLLLGRFGASFASRALRGRLGFSGARAWGALGFSEPKFETQVP